MTDDILESMDMIQGSLVPRSRIYFEERKAVVEPSDGQLMQGFRLLSVVVQILQQTLDRQCQRFLEPTLLHQLLQLG